MALSLGWSWALIRCHHHGPQQGSHPFLLPVGTCLGQRASACAWDCPGHPAPTPVLMDVLGWGGTECSPTWHRWLSLGGTLCADLGGQDGGSLPSQQPPGGHRNLAKPGATTARPCQEPLQPRHASRLPLPSHARSHCSSAIPGGHRSPAMPGGHHSLAISEHTKVLARAGLQLPTRALAVHPRARFSLGLSSPVAAFLLLASMGGRQDKELGSRWVSSVEKRAGVQAWAEGPLFCLGLGPW